MQAHAGLAHMHSKIDMQLGSQQSTRRFGKHADTRRYETQSHADISCSMQSRRYIMQPYANASCSHTQIHRKTHAKSSGSVRILLSLWKTTGLGCRVWSLGSRVQGYHTAHICVMPASLHTSDQCDFVIVICRFAFFRAKTLRINSSR